jgi:PAS domain S-box-containing protein
MSVDFDRATLRWLYNNAPQGILITDRELNIRGWNHWLEESSGRSAAEMLGRPLLEAFPELVERGLDSFYRQALAGHVIMLSYRFHRYLLPLPVQDNRVGLRFMPQSARIGPLTENDQIIGTITLIEDITDRVIREEELKHHLAIQDALHEIDRAILSLDLSDCLRRVVEKTSALVGAPVTAVVLNEPQDDGSAEVLRVAACVGGSCEVSGQPVGPDSIAAWAARSRQAILIEDTQAFPYGQAASQPLQPDSRSVVAAPLIVEERVIGALVAESPRPHAFTEAEQSLVIALATQAAIAIYNARLYTALRRRAAELEALYQTALATTATLDPDALLAELDRQVRRLIPADAVYITMFDPDKQELEVVLGTTDDLEAREKIIGMRLPLAGAGLLPWVARTGQTLYVGDVLSDPLPVPPLRFGQVAKRACLGVPLLSHERLVGVISMQSNRPHAFSDEDRRLLEALAAPIAIALENARLHRALRSYADELEQRVAERTAELEASNQALQEANAQLQKLNQLKDQFVANVSHELRTPLANIVLLLSLLERGKPEKHAYYLATLKRETDLLQRLIEDLLSLSRLDMGKTKMRPMLTDLNGLLGDIVRSRSELLASRGLTLTMHLDPKVPPIQADTGMLAQVFTNLLTNAMNYTLPGGMITVSTALRRVEDDAGPEAGAPGRGTWITFSVSDTGLGILPSERERLFERFFRGQAARQTGTAGTGLGLAICYELVRRHDGHITVESTPGEGSTFTVWLPAP